MNASEDCLFLHITRPSTPSPDPAGYPVLVFIYGGAFVTGYTELHYTSDVNDKIASRGMILVSFNYRVGPLGFLATGDRSSPGNYGLWDQVQALKFVNEIIPAFGGDTKRITIFGNSAGGSSVSWLTYSPAAKGLFQRAIPISGTAHSSWNQEIEWTYRSSTDLLKKTNCYRQKNQKECLKNKSVEELLNSVSTIIKVVVTYFDSKIGGV